MQANILTMKNGVIHDENSGAAISAARAVAKANGYLSKYVGVLFGAETPFFLPLERPVWQVSVTFKMNDIGPFMAGLLDVDAITGAILPLSSEQIFMIQERTDAYRELPTAKAGGLLTG